MAQEMPGIESAWKFAERMTRKRYASVELFEREWRDEIARRDAAIIRHVVERLAANQCDACRACVPLGYDGHYDVFVHDDQFGGPEGIECEAHYIRWAAVETGLVPRPTPVQETEEDTGVSEL